MGTERSGGTARGARRTARPRPGRRLPSAMPSARLQGQVLRAAAHETARASATGGLTELAGHRHALVVTFRRDGTPVATPVWAVVARGLVYTRVERGSGKVKRLRREPRALLAPCTARGRVLGPPLVARGRVLEAPEEDSAEDALADRHGLLRTFFEWTVDLMHVDMCYLVFTPQDAAALSSGDAPG
jgi:uncharacterized protein